MWIFYSKNGYSVLCDPWLNDGVFEGSWCHFHKLKTTIKDVQNVDAIYLSHIHPDHYDERFFDFPRDIPIITLDSPTNFLIKNLKKSGYTNLILLHDNESTNFKDFKITLFSPFVKHNFYGAQAVVGNVIDSAMIIENNGYLAFNTNDNTPDIETCKKIKRQFKHIDLLLHNYNAAGPYPACFTNLREEEKSSEHQRILNRNMDYMYNNIQELSPTYTVPFAGAYVLGGKLHQKNKYLGTTTWDICADYLNQKENLSTQIICLSENDCLNLETGSTNNKYVKIDLNGMNTYIIEELSKLKYPYELDQDPDLDLLFHDTLTAVKLMSERSKRYKLIADINVELIVGSLNIPIIEVENPKSQLSASLDPKLMRRILDRKAHWNNAEIGCHIEFNRVPNHYSPDIRTILQFLHL